MTDAQINNWREILSGIVGSSASLMRKEQIEKIHDNFQRQVDKLAIKLEEKEPPPKDDEEIVYSTECPCCRKEIEVISDNEDVITCRYCKESFEVKD